MDQVRRSDPGIRLTVPDIPPRMPARGVEFIEFAANEPEAHSLGEMFRTLGFRRVGRHISKDVEVWQQGDIRVVVNTDQEGFAHSAHIVHGLTVCDVGLGVDDAAGTVARAAALCATIFEQAVGPGEMTIPAIRGVGGGILHFIDEKSGLANVWDDEFTPVGDATGHDAGLERVDHLAQTMKYEQMLTWSLSTPRFSTSRRRRWSMSRIRAGSSAARRSKARTARFA